jgi:hypothetical protein
MLTDEQLVARRGYIGGSDVSAILGLDSFKSSFTVWLQKHEGYEAPRSEQLEAEADRGHHLEAGVLTWYGERDDRPVRPNAETFRSETMPIFGCTPDGFSLAPGSGPVSLVYGGAVTRLVSVKCPRRGDDWGEPGTDQFPVRHQLQLQWEHLVLESKGYNLDTTLDLAALIYGELKVYRVERNYEVQTKLAGFAVRWWQRHMVEGIPPSVDGRDETAQFLRKKYARNRGLLPAAATLEEAGLMMELQEAEAAWVSADQRFERSKQRVMEAIGEGAGLTSPIGKVTWKADKNGVRTLRTSWRKR